MIPKWREDWNQLVGDHKYLAIKNWDRYQESELIHGWIKDWLAKDEDPDYYTKPTLQRWMMDWCRRQRARLRKNLYADPESLLQRMNLTSIEVRFAPPLLLAMVKEGFLIPGNDPQPFLATKSYTGGRPIVDPSWTHRGPIVDPSCAKSTPQNEQLPDPKITKGKITKEDEPSVVAEPVQEVTQEDVSETIEAPPLTSRNTPIFSRCPNAVNGRHMAGFDGVCTACGNKGSKPDVAAPVGHASAAQSNGSAAAPKKTAVKSIRDWDEELGGFTAAEIRAAIIYHLDVSKKTWYKENLNAGFLRRGENLKRMMEDVPESVLHPTEKAKEPYRWRPY